MAKKREPRTTRQLVAETLFLLSKRKERNVKDSLDESFIDEKPRGSRTPWYGRPATITAAGSAIAAIITASAVYFSSGPSPSTRSAAPATSAVTASAAPATAVPALGVGGDVVVDEPDHHPWCYRHVPLDNHGHCFEHEVACEKERKALAKGKIVIFGGGEPVDETMVCVESEE